jgi:hypothetical protein
MLKLIKVDENTSIHSIFSPSLKICVNVFRLNNHIFFKLIHNYAVYVRLNFKKTYDIHLYTDVQL